MDAEKYIAELNRKFKKGCTAFVTQEGRIYYLNHDTRMTSWLPPVDFWDAGQWGLPYGWEAAVDKEGRTYFINHLNKTTTHDDPRKDVEEEPPQPRRVLLRRDPQMGFGFVAGSEKPVIVRFVTDGGPSEKNLLPGDQILSVNGENVTKAPREHVIELVRSCRESVTLIVCQPFTSNATRKSALLTAAKKAKLKSNPSRVRFAEGVVVNGSPLYSPSTSESCMSYMPNVLKVFLENGQTKSFKYDSTTTVQDVLSVLQEKLSITNIEHFGLVIEHIKSHWENRLYLLDPNETLSKIASKPGSHNLCCFFRLTFVPKDICQLLQKDPVAFEYLYIQCCNDVVHERVVPELKYDLILRLAALHIQQHVLSNGIQGKITIKSVEKDYGLERFVPSYLLETMKRKELRKFLGHFLKQTQAVIAPGQKHVTSLQAMLHYLKIISELPSYGTKCFSTVSENGTGDTTLLVSPTLGISHISSSRNMVPITLAYIQDVSYIKVKKIDELLCNLQIHMKVSDESFDFNLEEREAKECVLTLQGYYQIQTDEKLLVQLEPSDGWKIDDAPSYNNRHVVQAAPWSYPPNNKSGPILHAVDFTIPPPPYLCEGNQDHEAVKESPSTPNGSVDHNMNETIRVNELSDDDTVITLIKSSALETPVFGFEKKSQRLEERWSVDVPNFICSELSEYRPQRSNSCHNAEEINRIVSDFLDENKEKSTEITVDSLAALCQSLDTEKHCLDSKNIADLSASESDTDSVSTPSNSPLHKCTLHQNAHMCQRRGSSFGLHSPDVLPGFRSRSEDINVLLRQLQTTNDLQLPFAEGTLYLDPDIIDLTMIPPPVTPDLEPEVPAPLEQPPVLFLDKEKETKGKNNDTKTQGIAGVVAELDHLCFTLSQLHDTAADEATSETTTLTLKDLQNTEDIDTFIAKVVIPPPPVDVNCTIKDDLENKDIASFIIPPPPASRKTEGQEDIVASPSTPVAQIIEEENCYPVVSSSPSQDSVKLEKQNEVTIAAAPQCVLVPKKVEEQKDPVKHPPPTVPKKNEHHVPAKVTVPPPTLPKKGKGKNEPNTVVQVEMHSLNGICETKKADISIDKNIVVLKRGSTVTDEVKVRTLKSPSGVSPTTLCMEQPKTETQAESKSSFASNNSEISNVKEKLECKDFNAESDFTERRFASASEARLWWSQKCESTGKSSSPPKQRKVISTTLKIVKSSRHPIGANPSQETCENSEKTMPEKLSHTLPRLHKYHNKVTNSETITPVRQPIFATNKLNSQSQEFLKRKIIDSKSDCDKVAS